MVNHFRALILIGANHRNCTFSHIATVGVTSSYIIIGKLDLEAAFKNISLIWAGLMRGKRLFMGSAMLSVS